MRLLFRPLCSLKVQHEFYGDAPCPDFEFVLAEHSAALLAGHALRARVDNHQLSFYFEAADELQAGQYQPKQPIHQLELLIGLKLRNPSFAYITGNEPPATPLYQNTLSSLNPAVTSIICGTRAHLTTSIQQRPLNLSLHRSNDSEAIWQQTINSDELPTLDFSRLAAGVYVLKQQSLNQQQQSPFVLAPDLAAEHCWGAVKFVLDQSFWLSNDPVNNPAQPPSFSISFNARSQVFDYYLVANSDWNNFGNNLSVSAVNDTVLFQKIEQADLPADSIKPALLGAPDKQVLLFRSQNSLTRLAKTNHQFQLKRNGTTLVKQLPQPAADMAEARFIIHLTKP